MSVKIRTWICVFSFIVFAGCSTPQKVFRDKACVRDLEALAHERAKLETHSPRDAVVGLTREEIGVVFQRSSEAFKSCHVRHSISENGKFVFLVLINAAGKVERACAVETTFEHAEFKACMLDLARGLSFPPPKGGVAVKVQYPIHYSLKHL